LCPTVIFMYKFWWDEYHKDSQKVIRYNKFTTRGKLEVFLYPILCFHGKRKQKIPFYKLKASVDSRDTGLAVETWEVLRINVSLVHSQYLSICGKWNS
jgi:hypothetical protein